MLQLGGRLWRAGERHSTVAFVIKPPHPPSPVPAQVYMHAADQAWTSRKGHPRMQYWSGDVLPLGGGVSAVRIGGHFPGSCVLHIASSARDGKPVLLTSDNIHCVPHRRWLSFM
jgi:glyoxylase-like metal-dependent hydrolase (beta-lactamase superfamily II)